MTDHFFERPILNSPYCFPGRHWELDADGQPTNRIIETRRRSDLITPVPKPKKRRKSRDQKQMVFEDDAGLMSDEQEYPDANTVTHILGVRAFGTQLLCERVAGRGLRRQSYDRVSQASRNFAPTAR